MQTAEIIKFPVREDIKVADLENGYTRIANELYDALIEADLTKHQQKIAHAIVRLTYGFNKKNDRIADSQIADKTKLARCKVNVAKKDLLEMKVLIMEGRKIGINKNISEWEISKSYRNSNTIQNGNFVTETVTESVTETVTRVLPKTEHTKDIISKYKKHNNTPKNYNSKNSINFGIVVEAFNHALGDRLPKIKKLTNSRKQAIKILLKEFEEPTTQELANYFYDFSEQAKEFYFGKNDRGWKADFDYIVRTKTYIKFIEGSL